MTDSTPCVFLVGLLFSVLVAGVVVVVVLVVLWMDYRSQQRARATAHRQLMRDIHVGLAQERPRCVR